MSKITVRSRKPIFRAELFEVFKTDLKLSSGNLVSYHEVHRDPVVCVFPITDRNEIYLITQYRYLYEEESLEEVAGFINKNESPLHAAKRELSEETGLTAQKWKPLRKIRLAGSIVKSNAHLFLARRLTHGQASPEEDEHIALKKMTISRAVQKVFSGEINKATTIIGILLIDKLTREGKI